MFEKINQIFSAIDRELSVRHGSIEFAPVFFNGQKIEYLLLKEALDTGKFVVKESNEVPSLFVINDLDMPVLIIEGEELIGGRQNRVVDKTVLVREKTKVKIPVSCVEKGRWNYTEDSDLDFEDTRNRKRRRHDRDVFLASRVIDTSIRSVKLYTMTANASLSSHIKADQQEVWNAVDQSLFKAKATSSTSSAFEAYLKRKKELEFFKESIKPLDGQNGFAVFVDGSFYGFEYLSSSEKFKKYFDSIIDSYLMDLIDYETRKGIPRSETLPGEPEKIIIERSVSLGENVYLSWMNHLGHGLAYEGEFLQLSVLAKLFPPGDPIPPFIL